jgi:CheY-like chemotaxis protein
MFSIAKEADMSDILLIEKNKYDTEFTLEAFEASGLADKVTVVRDGGEALDYLFEDTGKPDSVCHRQPKLILLELNLPKVDGIEVLRRIRADEKTKMIPVIVFTSSTEDRDKMESYRLGANLYVIKPASHEEFVKTATEIGFYWMVMNAPLLKQKPPVRKSSACPDGSSFPLEHQV